MGSEWDGQGARWRQCLSCPWARYCRRVELETHAREVHGVGPGGGDPPGPRRNVGVVQENLL